MSHVGTRPKRGGTCPSVSAIFGQKQCTHAGMPLCSTVKCMWPKGTCPYTPPWQLFSSCLHERDAATSMYWHAVRSPFRVPFGIAGHTCQWEKMDDHLAGCTTCGKVHRCGTDQCEEILIGEPGFKVRACGSGHWSLCACVEREHQDQQHALPLAAGTENAHGIRAAVPCRARG